MRRFILGILVWLVVFVAAVGSLVAFTPSDPSATDSLVVNK